MVDDTDNPSYSDDNLIFVIRLHGKLFVTSGAYVYDPSWGDLSSEERRAIDYLMGKLGGNDVADLTNEDPPITAHCVNSFEINDDRKKPQP